MFEAAELGRKVGKKEYAERLPALREALLAAQNRLRGADFSVVLVLAGVEGAGRGELINRLAQWLDMRDVEVHAFDRVSDEESSRPEYWRYWRTLPPKGRISIYLNSWYTDPLLDRALGEGKRSRFERRLGHVARFERALTDSGVLLVKLWLHLSEKEQGKRLAALAKDERTAWRVTPARRRMHEAYAEVAAAAETAIRLTDTHQAPWRLVEAKNTRYRDLAVAHALAESIEHRLDEPPVAPDTVHHGAMELTLRDVELPTVLDRVDLTKELDNDYQFSDCNI